MFFVKISLYLIIDAFETFSIADAKELMLLSGVSNKQKFELDKKNKPLFDQPINGIITTPNDAFLKFKTYEEGIMKFVL